MVALHLKSILSNLKLLIMKFNFMLLTLAASSIISLHSSAQSNSGSLANTEAGKHLYIDVHHLEPGKVKYEDVAKAHVKDRKSVV